MKPLLGMAVVAAALAFGGPAAAAGAEKAPQMRSQAAKSDATDFSAHRRYYRYGYRPYRPYYRPYPTITHGHTYYRPYPYYVPAPFLSASGSVRSGGERTFPLSWPGLSRPSMLEPVKQDVDARHEAGHDGGRC